MTRPAAGPVVRPATPPGAGLDEVVHGEVLGQGGSAAPGRAQLAELVRRTDPLLPVPAVEGAVRRLLARVSGLGPLDALLGDDEVTDVLVNGPGPVWVERAGRLAVTDVVLDRPTIDLVVERIVGPLGRRVDPASPVVDGRLADGSRVHVVVPPLAIDGPCITIRRFASQAIPLSAAAGPGTVALLHWAVRARANVLVVGGTGSGKTTLLNALGTAIPAGERVVTVEDAAELRLPSDHVVRLETRPASVEGTAAVTCRDLVRNALRMRPDRLVVGEVRGGEALDMVQAMNTGHDGSLSTLHANGCDDALRRLETLVLLADVGLPLAAVRDHLASAVDLVVHVARDAEGRRRVVEVAEVVPPGAVDRVTARLLADASAVRRLPTRGGREPSAGAPSVGWCGR